MCKVLDIKKSSYYAWLKRPPSERKIRNEKIVTEIKRIMYGRNNFELLRSKVIQLENLKRINEI